jgi:uncharacterized membrane protein
MTTERTRKPEPHSSEQLSLGKGRFESFSDGVFAVAITLLILEIHLPSAVSTASSNVEQVRALLEIWPQYVVYAVSFGTIGIMWLNHHALIDGARRITYRVIVANLVLLGLISFLPFTTEVLARLGLTRPAVVYYGLTLTAISFGYFAVQRAIMAAHPGSERTLSAWNLAGLTFYPLATVAAFFVPLLGLGLIALLAVFYALPNNVRMARFKPPADVASSVVAEPPVDKTPIHPAGAGRLTKQRP